MKRILPPALLAISMAVASASVALAGPPADNHGADVSAVAKDVAIVTDGSHGLAVSTLAKTHGAEVSEAARAKGAAAAEAGKAKGAAAADAGEANGAAAAEAGAANGAAASEPGRLKAEAGPANQP